MFTKCSMTVAMAAVATLFCSGASAQYIELTTNGGFETGDFTGWTQFPTGPDQQSITSTNPFAGNFAAEIDNQAVASNSLIKQANIGIGIVSPGQEIKISFAARGSLGVGAVAFAEFFSELDGGGVSKAEILGGAPLALDADPNVWKTFDFTTTAGPNVSGGVTLQLGATTAAITGSAAHMFYDNVSVSVIPEPASATLLGLAGLGLLGALRRRNR